VRLARQVDGRILLEIDDDGAGFDTATPSSGMGLTNLRDRAASLGASLEIVSTAGEGTTLRVSLPG
jgi:signal transduction histidine kinase